MEITNFDLTSTTAIANGADAITASAVIMNGTTYVSDISIIFRITTGNAIFSNGQSSITAESNALGKVSATFVDTITETVIIEISLADDTSIHETLAATFTVSDNTVDTIGLLLIIDDAKADGEDQNQVELQTYSGAIPVGDVTVSVALTHGAVFINGESKADIQTDSNGRASLPFTSTTAGESKLTAYLFDNIAVYNSVTATFVSATPELSLVLDVVSDNAQANGKAVNRVRATVTDSDTLTPLSGQTVTFAITDGSAVFDNDSASYTATTDSSGEAWASLKDDVIESVTVTATAGDKNASSTVNFVKAATDLEITRVYNTNKSFPTGEPTVAWNGAEFSVDVSGGSGDYSWSVTEGGDVLSVPSSSGHSATFSFGEGTTFIKTYTIRATDNSTKQTVDYSFSITLYFTEFGEWEEFEHASKYPSSTELVRLYDEWGNMHSYPEWFTDARGGVHYWTNEIVLFFWARAVNITNGNVDAYANLLDTCGYARKSGELY